MISQRMLDWKRVKLLDKLERERHCRVIALVHRQETMSLLGFPIFRYINIEDSEEVLRAIKLTDRQVPINLILHSSTMRVSQVGKGGLSPLDFP